MSTNTHDSNTWNPINAFFACHRGDIQKPEPEDLSLGDTDGLRLFYGTSRARLKYSRRQDRLLGPHNRLCLHRKYEEAEYVACEAVARDNYHGNLMLAAGFKVEDYDYLGGAAAYALEDGEVLFRALERKLGKKQVARLAYESYGAAWSLCEEKLSKEVNGPVIAIVDGHRIAKQLYYYSLSRYKVIDPEDDECQDIQVIGDPIHPFGETLLGTADVPLSFFSSWSELPPSMFWLNRAPEELGLVD
jgi:hypothetical protein